MKSEKISKDDVAQSVAEKLNSRVSEVLHQCRDAARSSFFYEIGYIFVELIKLGVDKSQENMKISWLLDEEDIKWDDFVAEIRDMIQGPSFEHMRIRSSADSYHKKHWEV